MGVELLHSGLLQLCLELWCCHAGGYFM